MTTKYQPHLASPSTSSAQSLPETSCSCAGPSLWSGPLTYTMNDCLLDSPLAHTLQLISGPVSCMDFGPGGSRVSSLVSGPIACCSWHDSPSRAWTYFMAVSEAGPCSRVPLGPGSPSLGEQPALDALWLQWFSAPSSMMSSPRCRPTSFPFDCFL